MDPSGAQSVAALVDRYRLVDKLRLLHWQRVAFGVFGGLAAATYNLWHHPPEPAISAFASELVVGIYLVLGAVVVLARIESGRRAARRPQPTPREQALVLAEAVVRSGNAWLLWAAAGHVLVCAGTVLHLRFAFSPEATLLWLAEVPTLGLVVHGLFQVPTRERLLQPLAE